MSQFAAGHFPCKEYLIRYNLLLEVEVACDCGAPLENKMNLLLDCLDRHEAKLILRASTQGPLDWNSIVGIIYDQGSFLLEVEKMWLRTSRC